MSNSGFNSGFFWKLAAVGAGAYLVKLWIEDEVGTSVGKATGAVVGDIFGALGPSKVVALSLDTVQSFAAGSDVSLIVVTAPSWCPACKVYAPVLDQVAASGVRVGTLDPDDPSLAPVVATVGTGRVPLTSYVRGGKKLFQREGALTLAQVKSDIASLKNS